VVLVCGVGELRERTASEGGPYKETSVVAKACTSLNLFGTDEIRALHPPKDASVHLAGYSDAGLAEDMGDLRVAEARGVVFEGEMVLLLVDVEFAQAIGVGERAEAAELRKAQRMLQLVGDFEECHATNYTSSDAIVAVCTARTRLLHSKQA
jgi:hypothetical protein